MTRRLSPARAVCALALLGASLIGCSDSPVAVVPVDSVAVESPTSALQVGETAQLSAVARDAGGNALHGRRIEWFSSNMSVVRVDSLGAVQAMAAGAATITARSEGKSGQVALTVLPPPVAQVTLFPDSVTLPEGETRQLTVSLRDAGGTVLTGREIEWTSSDASIATVSASGQVRGEAAGTATITAASEGHGATTAVTVIPGPDPLIVPPMAVGEVFQVPAHERRLRVPGGASGAEYALIPFVSSNTVQTVDFRVLASGVQGVSSAAVPTFGPSLSLQPGALPRRSTFHGSDRWELRLRERELRELTPLVRTGGPRARASLQPGHGVAPAAVPSVGELLRLNVNSDHACENPDHRWGRVVAVTGRAIVVADTANPAGAGTFSDAEYQEFGDTFDQLVWPTNVENFGEPHDIDGNQRVVIFFTRAVNELTPQGQGWYVGGFFFARDLFPRTAQQGFQACPASNHAEMFYMLVPDPQGAVNGNVRLKDRELRGTVGVIAHEFQHLINASRRLYVVQAGGTRWNEEVWLNEGLSHIAEELMAYASSSLGPRQNIDGDRLAGSAPEQAAFFAYQVSNIGRLASYLENPDTTSLIGPDALSTRGAAWHFLRYAADRRVGGGTESSFWRGLIDSDRTGIDNLRDALGAEPMAWIRDWSVALYTDDLLPVSESRFTMPSWNLRSIYPRLLSASGTPVYGEYPLRTRTLSDGGSQSLSIRSGSAAYLRFGVGAGGSADVRGTGSSGGVMDDAVRMMLVRTR